MKPLVVIEAVIASALAAVVVRAVRPIRRVEIAGDSMRPTLQPGDRLLVLRGARARPGDLVTVLDPRDAARTIVKRVAPVPGSGGPGEGVVVVGDNPGRSTDSRTFGPVPRGSVRGRVVYRYHPDGRRGRLRAM